MAKEKKLSIPFNPFPYKALKSMAGKFMGVGAIFSKGFPYLELDLKQADMDIEVEEYGAIMAILFLFYFIAISIVMYLLATKLLPGKEIFAALTMGGIAGFLVFAQLSVYPKIQVKKKQRQVEQNLFFALRTIMIEIKSGVTLFDAMNLVAEGNYGQLGKEFKQTIEEINTGTPQEEALDHMASRNPSLFLRRALWQIIDGLKIGADVNTLFDELVKTMNNELKVQIAEYGGQLRMLSLMYMMMGVVMPSLGITLLIILASFPQVKVSEIMFWALLGLVVMGQFMFIGLMKSKRPSLLQES